MCMVYRIERGEQLCLRCKCPVSETRLCGQCALECRVCPNCLFPMAYRLRLTHEWFQSCKEGFREECRCLLLLCVRLRLPRDIRIVLIRELAKLHTPVNLGHFQLESEKKWMHLHVVVIGTLVICHERCIRDCFVDSEAISAFPLHVGNQWNVEVPKTLNGCNGLSRYGRNVSFVENTTRLWVGILRKHIAFHMWVSLMHHRSSTSLMVREMWRSTL